MTDCALLYTQAQRTPRTCYLYIYAALHQCYSVSTQVPGVHATTYRNSFEDHTFGGLCPRGGVRLVRTEHRTAVATGGELHNYHRWYMAFYVHFDAVVVAVWCTTRW